MIILQQISYLFVVSYKFPTISFSILIYFFENVVYGIFYHLNSIFSSFPSIQKNIENIEKWFLISWY